MFELNKHTGIEYVDDTWLHIHHSAGMTSILMERYQYDIFIVFLRGCLSQKPDKDNGDKFPSERTIASGDLTFFSEGPDGDHFNIFIDSKDARQIFPIGFYQIEDMLSSMENK